MPDDITDEEAWSETAPLYTDVGTYPIWVRFTTTDGHVETVKVTGEITPAPAPAGLAIHTVFAEYDAEEHFPILEGEEDGDHDFFL